jgi:hypothetical protein
LSIEVSLWKICNFYEAAVEFRDPKFSRMMMLEKWQLAVTLAQVTKQD